jgi:hypothetical protein
MVTGFGNKPCQKLGTLQENEIFYLEVFLWPKHFDQLFYFIIILLIKKIILKSLIWKCATCHCQQEKYNLTHRVSVINTKIGSIVLYICLLYSLQIKMEILKQRVVIWLT